MIKRCLDSVIELIDSWIIVDTGSTDGTQQVIRDVLKHKPGTLYERPWVNFGHNRQEALELAKGKADYILFMDADDTLSFSDNFVMPDLVQDFYAIKTVSDGKLEEYILPQIVKSNINWKWNGVLHEYINAQEDTNGSLLEGVVRVYMHDGNRGKDPNTIKRDINVLEEALKTDTNNGRYMFYLARYYFKLQDLKNAIRCYRKVPTMDAYEIEKALSKLRLGQLLELTNADPIEIKTSYLEAYRMLPNYMEPLYYLAKFIRSRGNYQKAYDIARVAMHVPYWEQGISEPWVYEYGLAFEYAENACELGKIDECLETCGRLLKKRDLPDEWQKNIESCVRKALKKMEGQILSQE